MWKVVVVATLALVLSACGSASDSEGGPSASEVRCAEAQDVPDVSNYDTTNFLKNLNSDEPSDGSWAAADAWRRKKAGEATVRDDEYIEAYYRYFQVVSDNEECFSVEDVADARQKLKGY